MERQSGRGQARKSKRAMARSRVKSAGAPNGVEALQYLTSSYAAPLFPTHEQALALKERAQARGVSLAPHTGTYCQFAREYCQSGATHAAQFSPFAGLQPWPAAGYRPQDFPRTSDLVGRMVSVPLGARFTTADAAHVGRVIREELSALST